MTGADKRAVDQNTYRDNSAFTMAKFKTRRTKPTISYEYTVKRIAQIVAGTPITNGPLIGAPQDDHTDISSETISNALASVHIATDNDIFTEAQQIPYLKENGTWVLDTSNNWFLRHDEDNPQDDEWRYWTIYYRYASPGQTICKQAIEALAKFLQWTLGGR